MPHITHKRKKRYRQKGWTKTRMIEWLVYHNIPFPKQALKSELFSIVQKAGFTPKYMKWLVKQGMRSFICLWPTTHLVSMGTGEGPHQGQQSPCNILRGRVLTDSMFLWLLLLYKVNVLIGAPCTSVNSTHSL